MRRCAFFIVITLVLCLTACKSKRHAVIDNASTIDSIAVKAHTGSTALFDSLWHSHNFTFDTLSVELLSIPTEGDTPVQVRLRAVRGSISADSREMQCHIETHNTLDTVAYKRVSTENTEEQTETVRAIAPANGTAIAIAAMLLFGIAIFVIARKW